MVTVNSSHVVKPAEPTPNEIMYMSECDQIRSLTHTPTFYIYRPTTVSVKDAVHTLKDSLSKALVTFYPLAGRLQWIGGGRVELHCNSMGALLLEAESELKIDDFGDFRPTAETAALIPPVDFATTPIDEIPLLLVQLTKLACGGLALGLALSHIVVDGQSGLYFVSEWIKIACGGGKPEDFPFFDRTILEPIIDPLAARTLEHSLLRPQPLLIGHSDTLAERKKPTTTTMLKISKELAEKLQKKANQGLENESKRSPHGFSKYEAIVAHAWRCASKARRHTSKQETSFYVLVDFRNRLNPPLPPRYFGNAILSVPVIATAGELLSQPLAYVAGKIRAAKQKVTAEYVNSYLVCIKNLPDVSQRRNFHSLGCTQGSFYGNPNFGITSWVGIPLHGADFGWGKEIFVGPAAIGYDGLGNLIPSVNGDGSFVIPLRLQVEHMDAFENSFYEDI